jgi:hypothetical protein
MHDIYATAGPCHLGGLYHTPSPQRKVKKGAQLAERGAWKAGIAERVKY